MKKNTVVARADTREGMVHVDLNEQDDKKYLLNSIILVCAGEKLLSNILGGSWSCQRTDQICL